MKAEEINQHDMDLVDDLADFLVLDNPFVRVHVVAAARARLADGDHPTALDLAGTLVAHFA
ncbi:MAG: hypothetical protein QOD38_2066 [Acidimicrobiaceae bacterium]|jgi:hypothetical protein